MERNPLNEQDHRLIELGLEVLARSFDDGVYNHTVGCALLCKNGRIYQGVNCDGIPPCGNCRQMLFEYCPDILVIVNDEEGNLIKVKAAKSSEAKSSGGFFVMR